MVLGRRFKLYFILCVWDRMAAAGNGNNGNLPPPLTKISMLRSLITEVFSEFPHSENNNNLLKEILTELLNKENDAVIKDALGQPVNQYNSTILKQSIMSYFRRMLESRKSTIRGGRRKHRTRHNKKQRKHRKHRTRKH